MQPSFKIAIVGSGPSGLMAATRLSRDPRFEIHIFEKRKGLGRKLLIAGSSGLNISHDADPSEFARYYSEWSPRWNPEFWPKMLANFSPKDWIEFIEKELRMETFVGTSGRFFVREMKASGLLQRWTEFLRQRGVVFHPDHDLTDFEVDGDQVRLQFNGSLVHDDPAFTFDQSAFFLGGASWLEKESPDWAEHFRRRGIELAEFQPSNAGYEVNWKSEFLKEAEGKPLKKILLSSPKGSKLGELVVTRYGLEGTPIYFFGAKGEIMLDLKPDLSTAQMIEKCEAVRENLSPLRRVKKVLGLGDAALALLFHHADQAVKNDLKKLIAAIKSFPLELGAPRPLQESISSKGGVRFTQLTEALELRKFPGIYCGGEMLDWDAPTGGFLIQASVSQGAWVAESILSNAAKSKRR